MGTLYIFSGAGLSAESGITTFRDSGGLWENHSIQEVCTLSTFQDNYLKVNEFYNGRRKQLAEVEPNAAHLAIAKAASEINVVNITTNVDDLLERAGCRDVIHLHGELTKIVKNYGQGNMDAEITDIGYAEVDDKCLLDSYPVKPAVIFFGEVANEYQKMGDILCDITADDAIVVVGSSENVITFSFLIAYTTHHRWEEQDETNRPKMFFVNPNPVELTLPRCFNSQMRNATDFFKSQIFNSLINDLKN